MPLLAAAAAVLALALFSAAPAEAAEPDQPLFATLGIETVDGRQGAVAAPLPGGRVLIAGGSDDLALRSAEIFDGVKYGFEAVPHLTRYARSRAMAAPLPDGRVLIAGGANEVVYAHAEIFDPETEEFTDVEDEMATGRIKGIAAPLPNGRVLIAGGHAEGETLDSAEVFDPATETFTALEQTMRVPRSGAVGVTLPSGKVLIAGGYGPSDPVRSSELFDPATGAFSLLGAQLPEDQGLAAGVALPSGDALIAGGISGGIPRRWSGLLGLLSGAFEYFPKEGGTQLTTARADAIAATIPDGKVLISGGSWPEARSSAEIFVPAAALDASGGQLGTHVLGQEPGTATVTVTSLGGWNLEIDAVSLAGPDAAEFAIVGDACSSTELDFEESCTLSVRFTPTRLGDAEAVLAFDDNEPVPAEVPLTVTAIAPPSPPSSQPLGPATPPRRAKSVRCGTKPIALSRRLKVTCRVNLAFGPWEAKLHHRGRVVAHRRILGGKKQLTFRPPSGEPGRYRLELIPLAA